MARQHNRSLRDGRKADVRLKRHAALCGATRRAPERGPRGLVAATCRWPATSRRATAAAASRSRTSSRSPRSASEGDRPLRPRERRGFSSYAVPTIAGELRRHFRDHTWALRVPRDIQEMAINDKVEPRCRLELGRAPTAAEVAGRLDCSVEQLLEARVAAGANRMSSLDAPVSSEDGEGASLADVLGFEDERLEELERGMALDAAHGRARATASARSCGCASRRSSRRPRSASASGSPRCTSRG